MQAVERSTKGIMDLCFDEIERIREAKDVDIVQKTRSMDTFLKHIWNGARMELETKKFMLKAPELAKAYDVPVMLGSPEQK